MTKDKTLINEMINNSSHPEEEEVLLKMALQAKWKKAKNKYNELYKEVKEETKQKEEEINRKTLKANKVVAQKINQFMEFIEGEEEKNNSSNETL